MVLLPAYETVSVITFHLPTNEILPISVVLVSVWVPVLVLVGVTVVFEHEKMLIEIIAAKKQM